MLNERRTLGLMRLRGVPGESMGRALLIAIVDRRPVGGVLGLVVGSVVPLLVYERGRLPLDVLTDPRQLLLFGRVPGDHGRARAGREPPAGAFATTISPLEASRRVSGRKRSRPR